MAGRGRKLGRTTAGGLDTGCSSGFKGAEELKYGYPVHVLA